MQLEIWSDIACPWCAVGERRLATALRAFEHAERVEVRWRSFELDPAAPRRVDGDYAERLAAKYGTGRLEAQAMIDRMTDTAAEDGLAFDFARIRAGNTFDAHRLLHLAGDRDLQERATRRFMRGYLEEGVAIGETDELRDLAVEAGLQRDEVVEVLVTDRYADAVRADERTAATLGISAVPCFVLDRRYAVEGAQPAEVLLGALRRAFDEVHPDQPAGTRPDHARDGSDHAPDAHDHASDGSCVDGRCAVAGPARSGR